MGKLTSVFKHDSRWLIAVIILWPLISMAMDAAEYLTDAQGYFDKEEYSAAVIQLKNALLADPENGKARLLLGRAYLKLENGPSALKELIRAHDLGVARELVLPPLGRAYLMVGQGEKLLQTINPEAEDTIRVKVDILLLHAQAYLQLRRLGMADEKFNKVLELEPTVAKAWAGKARIAFHNRDTIAAAELADRALAEDDKVVDAWILKGELFQEEGKQREAIQAFQNALDSVPTSVPALLGKSLSLIGLGEYDNALVETDQILKRYPNSYMAYYVKGLALYQQHQLTQAQESIQRALNLAPDHLASHLLAGAIHFQKGQLNGAEHHLRRYLSQRSGDKQATKLLAATLLKLNRPAAAIEVLEPGMPVALDDVQYLSLLGSAYLGQGDAAKGMDYLEKAIALAPESGRIRTQLAIVHLVTGEEEQAIGELESAVDLNQGLLQADVLLAMTYVQNQDFDKALVAAEVLVGKMSESPVPENIKGAAYFGKKDYKAARNSYENALKIQPGFLPAHLNLAQLDLIADDPVAAERRYEKVLSYDESNLKALVALAVLANHKDQLDEAEQWLKQAHDHHPKAIQPALMLADFYQRQGKPHKALDIARKMAITHPQDQVVLKTLADYQLKTGEDKEALNTLRSLIKENPRSPEAHYRLAMVQLKLGKSDEARNSLRQSLELQADYPAAQLAMGRLAISAKEYDVALNIAAVIKETHPDMPEGYELEGDVLFAQQESAAAAKVYAAAYNKSNSVQLARKIFWSRMKSGGTDAAYEALRNWLNKHPGDSQTRTLLATNLQQTGNNEQAIEEYLKVLKSDPDNVTALNNIAWLLQETGKPGAVQYAERAYELASDRPEVADTFGWLLVQNGDTNRGLLILQEARVKAPHIPDIHYHMAVALHLAGRSDEARNELARLLKGGQTFKGMDDARALQDKLAKQ